MKTFKVTMSIALAAMLMTGASAFATDPTHVYRSNASSFDWDDSVSNWQVSDGSGGWQAATEIPDFTDAAVTIRAAHTVTLTSSINVGTLTVKKDASPALMILGSGANMTVNNASGVEAEVDTGTPANSGVVQFSATSGNVPTLTAAQGSVNLVGQFVVANSLGGQFAKANTNDSFELLSNGTITAPSGPLTIAVPIENDGLIKASSSNSSYTITFTAAPVPGSAGLFEVSGNSNAHMIFQFPDLCNITSGADFLVTDGTLELLKPNSTTVVQLQTNGGFRTTSSGGASPQVKIASGYSTDRCWFKPTGAFSH